MNEEWIAPQVFLKNDQILALQKKDWDKLLNLLANHAQMLEYLDSRLISLREELETLKEAVK